MKETIVQDQKSELLSQNFKNLVSETEKIWKSSNPLEALQLAAMESQELFDLYEDFEKVLEATTGLFASGEWMDILYLFRDEQMISEEAFNLFALVFTDGVIEQIKQEEERAAKAESAIEIRDRVYAQAKNWVKIGLTEIPDQELEAVRADVFKTKEIDEDIFNDFRGQLGSAILYRAEGKSQLDVAKALHLVEILFGKRQAELTKVVYQAYKMAGEKLGFELRYRNGQDRPNFNPGTINLVRNTLDGWYDREKDNLSEAEVKKIEAVLYALDSFLIGISRRTNPARAALLMGQRKMREGIREVSEMDALIKENLLPKNLEDLLWFIETEKSRVHQEMSETLSHAGTIDFLESKVYLENLRFMIRRLETLSQEAAKWQSFDEEGLKRELAPRETKADQLVKYIELEIKQLQGEETNLENMLDRRNLTFRQKEKAEKAVQAVGWRIEELNKLRDSLNPRMEGAI